ncbi:Retrotransposon-derived protein PEG10, partial [Zancudomyces culisetae]
MEPFSPEQVEFLNKAAVTLPAVEEALQQLLIRVEKAESAIKEHPATVSKKIYDKVKADTTKSIQTILDSMKNLQSDIQNSNQLTQSAIQANQLEIQSLQDQLSTLRNEVILYITENRATKVASTSEPSIKVRHPDTFSGKPSACSNFFSQLALVFAASPDKFNTDSSKVLYAISYLSGTPFSYMEPYLMKANLPESDRPAILSNYNLFKETITRAFGDPNPIENADRAIRQLRQTTSVAAYATEFRRLQMLIDWNQPPLISQFLSGLKYNVSQELNRREPIEDIDTLISTAIQIDNRLFSHPQRRQPPVNPTATMPPKPTAYNPFASPVSAPSTTPPANSDGPQPMDLSTASSTRRPPLTPAQRAYRIENNLCLYCGGNDHFNINCPKKR